MKKAFLVSLFLVAFVVACTSSEKPEQVKQTATPESGVKEPAQKAAAPEVAPQVAPKKPAQEVMEPKAMTPGLPGETVAVVDGVVITDADVDAQAKGELQQMEAKIYQVRKGVLNSLIDNILIEKAAQKKGMTKQAYLNEEVNDKIKPPTEGEIKDFYDKRKAQIRQPFDQVKGRIVDHLKRTSEQKVNMDLVAKLKKDANIKIRMEPPRVEVLLEEELIVVGDHNAEIILVEFSDYQCPYSKRTRETVEKVLETYKGKVGYAFLDFPLAFHKEAPKAHEAAHCAGEQGKYTEYSKKLFNNQKKLSVDDLKKYAKDLKLDTKKFNQCLDQQKYAERVQQLTAKGRGVGVSGTPAFFINGIMISGAQPYEAFEEVIEGELNR